MALTKLTVFPSVRSALLCGAMAAPAFVPGLAMAQDQADPCAELEQAAADVDFENSDISRDEFDRVVQGDDAQQCEAWLVQVSAEGVVRDTERARVRLEDEVVIEGRVIVDQQSPKVDVQEQAAEVSVSGATPGVNVSQGPIDIVVRQAAPRVTLDIPQPTVTIDQPAPEIIVTMPDPNVDVADARPKIEVRQAEPRVQVTVPKPEVELDLYQAEDPENSPGIAVEQRQAQAGAEGAAKEADVTMNRAEPKIIFQDSEQQANVQMSRSEPKVRFEQAEAEVKVNSSGEPKVNWTQSGEPTVRFADNAGNADDADARQATGQNRQADASANANGGTDASNDTAQAQADAGQATLTGDTPGQNDGQDMARNSGPNVRRDGYERVDLQNLETADLEGTTVYGVRGQDVSEIGELSMAEDQPETVIVDVGALTGADSQRVEIPFTDLTVLRAQGNDDLRVYIDASQERLTGYPEAG
ncbi:PRC-barrel domain-containing protein [Oceaniglobus roseus]|uniref:PRC-barrel domain-containing protein n=1 Tax=Oceaniglobus roseus TaxID=1737570 RepID=UPI0012FFDB98|nr:PRC-barrel domain-containing protein [Kandeliimicrobium roseum]